MLEVRNIRVCYDRVPAIHDVSLRVNEREIVALVGSNGAGKRTTVRTISGFLHPTDGAITFCGERIERAPAHEILQRGIAQVPEGRHIFGRMSVLDNLRAGAYSEKDKVQTTRRLERVFALFPLLRDRQKQRAGTLSGGEQQMLAIGRALMCGPTLLILDEPSLGLAPLLALEIINRLADIRDEGTAILLIEQSVHNALRIADRGYVLQTGRVVTEGKGSELMNSEMIRRAYLGL